MKKTTTAFLLISAPAAAVCIWLAKGFWISISKVFPECTFHKVTGLYCPGCGNTRSVLALLDGDIIGSLRYNITPITLLLLAALVYMELLFKTLKLNVRLLPRNKIFWSVFISSFFIYYIIRNFAV